MSEPTMKPEFGAGRLTTSEYVVALEDEIHRLHEAYEFAAAQATENAIVAVRAMLKLERTKEAALIRDQADKLREIVETSAAKRAHPAGSAWATREWNDYFASEPTPNLSIVKEAD